MNKDILQLIKEAAAARLVKMPTQNTVEVYFDRSGLTATYTLDEAVSKLEKSENGITLLKSALHHVTELREYAYRAYQFDWLQERGLGITDLFASIIDYAETSDNEGVISDKHEVSDMLDDWESGCGFSGQIWACYDEFLDAEYLNLDFMLNLLPVEKHGPYLEDYCRLTDNRLATLLVTTRDGVVHTERCLVDHFIKIAPRLVRLSGRTPWAAARQRPDEAFWREAVVREDCGREYSVTKQKTGWDIEMVPF